MLDFRTGLRGRTYHPRLIPPSSIHPMPPEATPSPSRPTFLAALILFGVALWPIVNADRFYIDDLGRARLGYLSWTPAGRPLANFVVETLNFGTPISDLSPFLQLIALLMVAGLALVLKRRMALPGNVLAPMLLAPLAAGPFFLENLSYKFDAITMVMATVVACLAALGATHTRGRQLLGGVALLATLCLYQPAFDVFPVFAIGEFVLGQRDLAPFATLLKTLLLRVLQALGALLVYRYIANAVLAGRYETAHAVTPPLDALPRTIVENALGFWQYTAQAMPGLWAKPIVVFMAAGGVVMLWWSVRYAALRWRAARPAARAGMIATVAALPCLMYLAPWGPMLGLQSPVLAPRVMIGFGALGTVALLFVWTALARLKLPYAWQVGVLAVPIYSVLMFCYVYGNSLKMQKEYEHVVSAEIAADLGRLAAQRHITAFTMRGSLDYSPIVTHTIRKYPLIGQLVPVYLREGWSWGDEQLRFFGVHPKFQEVPPGERDGEIVAISANYRIFVVNGVAVIDFD
jgi:hypothetical protein